MPDRHTINHSKIKSGVLYKQCVIKTNRASADPAQNVSNDGYSFQYLILQYLIKISIHYQLTG